MACSAHLEHRVDHQDQGRSQTFPKPSNARLIDDFLGCSEHAQASSRRWLLGRLSLLGRGLESTLFSGRVDALLGDRRTGGLVRLNDPAVRSEPKGFVASALRTSIRHATAP